jgi:hypothetical protein
LWLVRHPRALAATALALALSAALAGCAGGKADGKGSPTTTPDNSAYLPTGTPTNQVTMLAKAPADYTRVPGKGFVIWAPPEFQRSHRTSSNGEDMLVLEKPTADAALPERVAVIRDVQPRSSAAEQSFALETAKSAAGPQGQVERTQLPTPEGQSAFLVRWVEKRPSASGGTTEVQYWQLLHQVDAKLIINVVALAPAKDFPTSEVGTILRTFRVGGSAGA